ARADEAITNAEILDAAGATLADPPAILATRLLIAQDPDHTREEIAEADARVEALRAQLRSTLGRLTGRQLANAKDLFALILAVEAVVARTNEGAFDAAKQAVNLAEGQGSGAYLIALEILAEVVRRSGDIDVAAAILHAAGQLRVRNSRSNTYL